MYFVGEEAYKQFNKKLVSTQYEILGVRVPVIRNTVKQLIKDDLWQQVLTEVPKYHEEVQLHSFLLAAAPMTINERQQRLQHFFSYIDNWQVVDGLCSSLKEVKMYPQCYWDWLMSLRDSKQPFVVRFIIVMYLVYYLEEPYLESILSYVEQLTVDHYYVKMAVAWTLSIAFIKHRGRITQFFKETAIETWTYNKAIQKIIESKQISPEIKDMVRSWKRK